MVDKENSIIKMFRNAFKTIRLPDRKLFWGAMFLNILNAILPFFLITLNGVLLTSIVSRRSAQHAVKLLVIITVISCLNSFYRAAYNWTLSKIQIDLNLQIEKIIFEKVIRLQFKCFEDSKVYDLLLKAKTEGMTKPFVILTIFFTIINNIVQFVSVIGILVSSRIDYIEILFIASLIFVIPNMIMTKKEHKFMETQILNQRKRIYFQNLLTNYSTVKEIKIFGLGKKFVKKLKEILLVMCKEQLKLLRIKELLNLTTSNITLFITLLIKLEILKNTINGMFEVGQMTVYFQTISKVDTIISQFTNSFVSLHQATLYVQHFYEFIELKDEEDFLSGIAFSNILEKKDTIEFRNVCFKYPRCKKQTLSNINFLVEQNDIISIIGKNGAGKSTLLNLLTRLYDYSDGEILYNSYSLRKINIHNWREEFKYVGQEYIKYELTLKENIDICNSNDYDRFEKVISLLDINAIICKLENGVE